MHIWFGRPEGRKKQYNMAHEVSKESKDILRSWTTGHSGSILVTSLAEKYPVYTWGGNFFGGGNIKILYHSDFAMVGSVCFY